MMALSHPALVTSRSLFKQATAVGKTIPLSKSAEKQQRIALLLTLCHTGLNRARFVNEVI